MQQTDTSETDTNASREAVNAIKELFAKHLDGINKDYEQLVAENMIENSNVMCQLIGNVLALDYCDPAVVIQNLMRTIELAKCLHRLDGHNDSCENCPNTDSHQKGACK